MDQHIIAVIDIGSSAIRMVVAEVADNGSWRTLERAIKPLSLGRDVFVRGYLRNDAIRDTIGILDGFRELLAGWRIEPASVRVIATAAIREAKNRDAFVDRVSVRTGFSIDVVEGIEENHLTYVAVQHAISQLRPQFSRSSAAILEVGGGTTEIMLLSRGRMVGAHSLRIGALRIVQALHSSVGRPDYDRIEEYLREHIRVNNRVLNAELPLDRIKYFVAVGGDARIAARHVGRKEADLFAVIERPDFDRFLAALTERSIDDAVAEWSLTYSEAEGLAPALMTYKLFLDATSATQLIVPDVSIREGVFLSVASGRKTPLQRDFSRQVVNSAVGLGRKFHFDEAHARHVATLATALFDQMVAIHAMGERARVLLEVAAVVHDIGNYIRFSGHHRHGQYIVENSEIFGLSRNDIRVVGNVVRYHRRGLPNPAHVGYNSLTRDQRTLVLKLCSLVRVADALDRGHTQRVRSVLVEPREEEIVIRCEHSGDLSTERYALKTKGRMFTEVFGYEVIAL